MTRRPSPIKTIKLTTTLPQDIHTQLSLHLYSELEGCIPPASFQRFISARCREFFSERRLDLAPYVGSLPGEVFVHGSPAALRLLVKALTGVDHGEATSTQSRTD
jgi:hypothetical protein